MQLSVITDRVKKNLGRTDTSGAIDTEIYGFVNDTRRELAPLTHWEHLYYVWTDATVASQKEYDFPTDMIYTFDILVDGKKVIRVPEYYFDQIEDQGTDMISEEEQPEYWIKRGRKYWLIGIPNQVKDIEIRGQQMPVDLTLPADEDYFCEWYPNALIWGASYKACFAYEENQKGDRFLQLYSGETQRVIGQDRVKRRKDKQITIRTWRDWDASKFNQMMSRFNRNNG